MDRSRWSIMPFAHLASAILGLLLLQRASCQTGLSGRDEGELLDAHNHFRSIVIPAASNMERMTWSNELAEVAQNYAQQCTFRHNGERTSQQGTFNYVGENLAITSRPDVNYTDLVRNWFDERQDYDYETNSCNYGAMCGHYTQVVWATSSFVGCGAFRCVETDGFDYRNAIHLVCNYGPSGNYYGYLPYKSGPPCSQCSEGLNDCITNLCSNESTPVSHKNTKIVLGNTMSSGGYKNALSNVASKIHAEYCVTMAILSLMLFIF